MRQPAHDTTFIARDYDVFGGLDVDKKSMAVTFRDHGTMRKSLKQCGDLSPLWSAAARRRSFTNKAVWVTRCDWSQRPKRRPVVALQIRTRPESSHSCRK